MKGLRKVKGLGGAVLACLLALPATAHAAPKPWQDYVLAPTTPLVAPVRIVGVAGTVDNADALVTHVGVASMTWNGGDEPPPEIIVDYGREIGGFPIFGVNAVTGAPTLRTTYSEKLRPVSPDGDYAGKTRLTRVQELPLTAAGRFKSSQLEGGQRYQRLTLSAPGSVALSGASIVYTPPRTTADKLRGHFLSSDDLLNRIWYAGVYTAELNTMTKGTQPLPNQLAGRTVLMDGAKRDRRIWAGDLLTAGPTVFYALDPVSVKNSLAVLARHPSRTSDVFVPANGKRDDPGPMPGVCSALTRGGTGCRSYSATYSMAFVIALADYYRYTGDRKFAKRMWPLVERQMAWNADQLSDRGLFEVDYLNGFNWNLESFAGELTYVNGVYVQALNAATELAGALGPNVARGYRLAYGRRAAKVTDAVNKHLWRGSRGAYDLSTTEAGPIVQDANVLAVLSGIAPPRRAERTLDTIDRALATPFGARNVSDPKAENFKPVISPFVGGLQLLAQLQHDHVGDALALIRKEWGLMVDTDPGNTTWERITTEGLLNFRASAAHSWSSGATGALSGYVLGVLPVSPGFATWTVRPQPGDLEWAKGSVPTAGGGELRVSWRHRTEPRPAFTLKVAAPKGTRGTVSVPLLGGARVIRRDGRRVDAARDGAYAVLDAQRGSHTYTWTAKKRR